MFYAYQAIGTFEERDREKFKLKFNKVFKRDFKNGSFPPLPWPNPSST